MGFFDWLLGIFRNKDAADWTAEARERLARGKAARALAAAERAVVLAPEDADLRLLRADIEREVGLPQAAIEDLLVALELDPGRAAGLLAALEELEAQAPDPHRVWLHTWRLHAAAGDLDRAAAVIARLAGLGRQATGTLRSQCEEMLAGAGDRRAAQWGLALLSREQKEPGPCVANLLAAVDGAGKAALAFADRVLADLDPGNAVDEVRAARVAIRLRSGKEAEAREEVVGLCRKDADAGVAMLEQLYGAGDRAAAFALALAADLEKAGRVPVALSRTLAERRLEAGNATDAACVLLRAVANHPDAAADLLPLATRCMKSGGGLDAHEAHARAAIAAGDPESALLTIEEFVDEDPARASRVLEDLPAEVRGRGAGALVAARALAGTGDHEAAASAMRRWALGRDAVEPGVALPQVAAAAARHPATTAYAYLLHDLQQVVGAADEAGAVLLDIVRRDPDEARDVSGRAGSLLGEHAECFPAHLAAARAGLVLAQDPGLVLRHLRAALEIPPRREAEVLAELEAADAWITGVAEPVELFRTELTLRAGRIEDGLAALEEVVTRNIARGAEALAVLKRFRQDGAAADARVLLAEHRLRLAQRDHEGAVQPLRRVADLFEERRVEVLEAVDALLAEAPTCRGGHRAGVEIALRIGRSPRDLFARLRALLEIPQPPRDTGYCTRRAATLMASGPHPDGHRLLARCHYYAERWPLAVEEIRRLVEADRDARGEAIHLLGEIVEQRPTMAEPRFLLATLHSAGGAVDDAREALRDIRPRTEEVFDAWQQLVEAYPSHEGVRFDFVDALIEERRLDTALEEIGRLLQLPGGPGEELVLRVQRVLDSSPEYGPALYGLADAHHALGNWQQEIEASLRVIRLAPQEAETVLQRLDRILDEDATCFEAAVEVVRLVRLHQRLERVAPGGRKALELADTPERVAAVAAALESLAADFPRDAAFQAVLGEARARDGRAGAALEAWQRVLDVDGTRATDVARAAGRLTDGAGNVGPTARRLRADATLLSGDGDAACAAVVALRDAEPDAVTEVRERFDRILARHPGSRAAFEGLADACVGTGDAAAAVDAILHGLRQHPHLRRDLGRRLDDMLATFPDSAAPALALAEFIHLPLDTREEAAAALETALTIDPECHRAVRKLADLLLDRDPEHARTYRVMGKALAMAGDANGAVEAFRKVAALDARLRGDALTGIESVLAVFPDHLAGRRWRAELLLDLGRAEEAEAEAAALVERLRPGGPGEYRALVLLASARERQGDFDGGLAALRLAGERHPDEASVAPRIRGNAFARWRAVTAADDGPDGDGPEVLERAAALLRAGRLEDVLGAIGPKPAKGVARLRWTTLRARALLRRGAVSRAVEELEETLKGKGAADPSTPIGRDALYFAGRGLLEAGELVRAIRRLEQVSRADPGHRRVAAVLERVYEDDRTGGGRPLSVAADLEEILAVRGADDHG